MPSSDPMRSGAVHEAAAAERFDGLTDADLVGLLADGDARALRALYRRYSRPVYAMVLRMLRDEPTTEEVVQDAFVRVWRNAIAYDPSRNFPTWLLGLAHNLAVDELRHRRVRPPIHDPRATDTRALDEQRDADRAGDPQESAEMSDARAAIRGALSGLPGPQRAAIELAYFGGLSQSEIAEATGLPLGTIKSRIRFGMKALQEALGVVGFGPASAVEDV